MDTIVSRQDICEGEAGRGEGRRQAVGGVVE
jgi:hypothetical protein